MLHVVQPWKQLLQVHAWSAIGQPAALQLTQQALAGIAALLVPCLSSGYHALAALASLANRLVLCLSSGYYALAALASLANRLVLCLSSGYHALAALASLADRLVLDWCCMTYIMVFCSSASFISAW
ncbi:hypothetical protein COO60DRAFT_1475783 [Scenedesmus sp. NREL 46B-D3]|nr:hypothetical protein COO60DRAFT_1475783 [Scenedesmus sp. NREL 46B-D3]